MTLIEIKQEVSKLKPEERRELNAFLVRLRNESPEGRSELDGRMSEMDQGRRVSADALEGRLAQRHGNQV